MHEDRLGCTKTEGEADWDARKHEDRRVQLSERAVSTLLPPEQYGHTSSNTRRTQARQITSAGTEGEADWDARKHEDRRFQLPERAVSTLLSPEQYSDTGSNTA